MSGNYGIGYTFNGKIFFFDLEDYDKIKNYSWYINSGGYVQSHLPMRNDFILQHRIIMNPNEGNIIDHINHLKFDNRKCNLRECGMSQNAMNKKNTNKSSGYTGVSWQDNMNAWRARIKYNNKEFTLGYFDSIENAIKIRKEAEEKYFGEFSYDNSMAKAKQLGIPIISEGDFIKMIES